MNRRELLKTSVVGGMLAGSGAFITTVQAAPEKKYDCDVLVIGGGNAGLCASISAKQTGAKKVILVEKGAFCGGHTALSGSGYWAGGTDIQKAAGIDDSVEINWKDAVDRGLKANTFLKRDVAVVRQVYEKAPECLKWLQSLGVKFVDQPAQGTGNRKRIHYFYPGNKVGSPVEVQTLKKKADELGIEFIFKNKLVSLIQETKEFGSRVIGAVIAPTNGKGEAFSIYAKGGVVLACGGYANSPELVARYHPYLKGSVSLGSKLNTGDGIVAATNIGANMIMDYNGFGFNVLFVSTTTNLSVGAPLYNVPILVVGKDGKRIRDETGGYLRVCHQMMKDKKPVANWIWDQKAVDKYRQLGLKIVYNTQKVNSYNSLEELAKGEGIDAENLVSTFRDFNEDVPKGEDRHFGRKKLLELIQTPPFFTCECEPRIYTSYSGIEINTDGNVVNTAGKAIPGLFAAGDVTGHLAYQANLGGGGVSGLSMGTVYGRISGANAAKASL